MLTRFITSQCDHGGYLCMGTNNPLSLQESWHLPPSSINLVGQTRESLVRLPAFPLFLPLLPLHSPSTRGTTKEMESQAQLTQQHRSQTPKTSILPSGVVPGTSLRLYWTEFAWSQPEQRKHKWQRAYRRRPTALETQEKKKTTETESRSSLATVYACTLPRLSIPGKFGCQPIKLELHPLAHTYPANYVRVHFRHLGVYKGSRVATEPFGLGLAKV